MATYIDIEQARIPSAPTDTGIFYPEEDGQPMAATDLHKDILMRTIYALTEHFSPDTSVYVSGDILMYYVQGFPEKVVAPDVLVTFGIGNKRRRTYKVWEAGKVPDFAMEFSSENTYHNDLSGKKALYASLGIRDYFLYDAEARFLPTPLMGYTLVDAAYKAIPEDERGNLRSAALNLDFHAHGEGLGIFNPVTGRWLRTRSERTETAEERAEQEVAARKKAEAGQRDEATARKKAEAREQEEAAARKKAEAREQEEAAARKKAEAREQEEAAGRRKAEAREQEEAAGRKKTEAALEKADAEILQLREAIERLQTRR